MGIHEKSMNCKCIVCVVSFPILSSSSSSFCGTEVNFSICNGKYIRSAQLLSIINEIRHSTCNNRNSSDNQPFECKQPLAECMSQETKWISWLSVDKLNVRFLCLVAVGRNFEAIKNVYIHRLIMNVVKIWTHKDYQTLNFPQIFFFFLLLGYKAIFHCLPIVTDIDKKSKRLETRWRTVFK